MPTQHEFPESPADFFGLSEDQLSTYQIYTMRTHHDGKISGTAQTNDPYDHGQPSGYDMWTVKCPNREVFDSVVGRSRVGCGGCVVTVYLDGQRI